MRRGLAIARTRLAINTRIVQRIKSRISGSPLSLLVSKAGLKNGTPVITIDCKPNRISRSARSKSSMLMDSFGLKDTNYRNVADITDPAWVLRALQAALDEPRTKELQSSISRKNIEYDYYLEKIANLFPA